MDKTMGFLNKLEKKRSDAMYYMKILDQNIKYMRKRNIAVSAKHFDKTVKSQQAIEKEIRELNEKMFQVSSAINIIKDTIRSINEEISSLKKQVEGKILKFRKKNERQR
jgi:chromosome segregation ATPase